MGVEAIRLFVFGGIFGLVCGFASIVNYFLCLQTSGLIDRWVARVCIENVHSRASRYVQRGEFRPLMEPGTPSLIIEGCKSTLDSRNLTIKKERM